MQKDFYNNQLRSGGSFEIKMLINALWGLLVYLYFIVNNWETSDIKILKQKSEKLHFKQENLRNSKYDGCSVFGTCTIYISSFTF